MYTFYPRWQRRGGDYRRSSLLSADAWEARARKEHLLSPLTISWADFGNIVESIDVADFGGSTFYLEMMMQTSSATRPARARLYDVTSAAAVVGSEIETTSTSVIRARSPAVTLVGDREYKVQIGV